MSRTPESTPGVGEAHASDSLPSVRGSARLRYYLQQLRAEAMPAQGEDQEANALSEADKNAFGDLWCRWLERAEEFYVALYGDTHPEVTNISPQRYNRLLGNVIHILSTRQNLRDLPDPVTDSVESLMGQPPEYYAALGETAHQWAVDALGPEYVLYPAAES